VHSFRSVGDESTFVVVLCRARILGRKALGVAQGLLPATFVHPPRRVERGEEPLALKLLGSPS
jgi:hypothetical protein